VSVKVSRIYADFRNEGIFQKKCTGKKVEAKNRFSRDFFGDYLFFSAFFLEFCLR
jgi:hypothetical protein